MTHSIQKIFAKAIYDNIAETTDELAFKRGDILTVIERDTDGYEGWWLCTLRERQGICPGNRLRIISSSDASTPTASCYTPPSLSSPLPSMNSPASYHNISVHSDYYENRNTMHKPSKRRSWHIMPNKVVTPQKCGDVYYYDLALSGSSCSTNTARSSPYQNLSIMSDIDTYDTPKSTMQISYDTPRQWSRTPPAREQQPPHRPCLQSEECYDVPRPANSLAHQHNITPSSSNSSLLTSDSISMSSSNRSSLANMPDYDIPRRNPPTLTVISSPQAGSLKRELPLELASALDTLAKLQQEATTAVTKLLGFVSPNWRCRDKLDPILMDLKLAAVRLRTALHDLSEFGDGALGNAAQSDDKSLVHKLRPLVKALRDADKLVHKTSQSLDQQGWTLDSLARNTETVKYHGPPDSLDQLIACAQNLTEDVRQSASFIQGNATLLFKRTIISSSSEKSEWLEDCDYVSLESKEMSAMKNAELRDALPRDLQTKFDDVVKSAENAACHQNDKSDDLNSNDKSLLTYYAKQTVTHIGYLTQAIDAFLQTVERNQPPKFFLAYGKFVVVSAHNLVNIGDIVHRNVLRADIKNRVLQCADSLTEALKTCVAKTKKAAQHFPSVTAVQEMVDSVVDISHLASDLKVVMLQAVMS